MKDGLYTHQGVRFLRSNFPCFQHFLLFRVPIGTFFCVRSIQAGVVREWCVHCRGRGTCHHRKRRRACKICLAKPGKISTKISKRPKRRGRIVIKKSQSPKKRHRKSSRSKISDKIACPVCGANNKNHTSGPRNLIKKGGPRTELTVDEVLSAACSNPVLFLNPMNVYHLAGANGRRSNTSLGFNKVCAIDWHAWIRAAAQSYAYIYIYIIRLYYRFKNNCSCVKCALRGSPKAK